MDARAKRCRFLEDALRALELPGEVVEGRAEAIGRSSRRQTADAVVARSFGLPATTVECGSPLLTLGGRLIVSEPPPPIPPDRWPVDALATLGLELAEHIGAGPSVQVLVQRRSCPDEFPRRDGLPGNRPLF